MDESKTLREQVEEAFADAPEKVRVAVLVVVELAEAGLFDDLVEWAEVEAYLRYNFHGIADEYGAPEDIQTMHNFAEEASLAKLAVMSEAISVMGREVMGAAVAPMAYVLSLVARGVRMAV